MSKVVKSCQKFAKVGTNLQTISIFDKRCQKLAKIAEKMPQDDKSGQTSWQKLAKVCKRWQKLATIVKSLSEVANCCQMLHNWQKLAKVAKICQKLPKVAKKNAQKNAKSWQKLARIAQGCQKLPCFTGVSPLFFQIMSKFSIVYIFTQNSLFSPLSTFQTNF